MKSNNRACLPENISSKLSKSLLLCLSLSFVMISNTCSAADYSSNLVGWWKLDDGTGSTTVDSSGQGNNGSLYNAATWTTGISGNAIQFDGLTSYVEAVAPASILFTNPATVSILAKRTSGTDYKEFFNLSDSLGRQVINLSYGSTWNGLLISRKNNTNAQKGLQLSSAIDQSGWNHIVVTNPGGDATSTVYVNGVLNSATTTNVSSSYGTSVMQIGKGINDSYNTALIGDDVRVYNRALSAADVSALFATYDTAPSVSSFEIPSTATMSVFANSASVSVTSLVATDNFGINDYLINESASTPSPSDSGWSSSTPTTVTVTGSGTHTVYAWARNRAGVMSQSTSTDISVTAGTFAISASELSQGTPGLSYSQSISATAGGSSYTWSVASGSLPPGLSLDTGSITDSTTISGTPTTPGSYTFSIQAVSEGHTAVESYSLTIKSLPSFTANSDIVQVAPYDIIPTGTGNWGSTVSAAREFITIGQRYRIRQAGTISRVRLYAANLTNVTAVYIKVWRYNGSTYDLVGTSNNILGSLSANSTATVDLSSAISGVHEGDYYGYRIEGSNPIGYALYAKAGVTGVTSYYVDTATPSSTNYAWASQTAVSGSVVPIELYEQAPQMAFIGDSIIAGHPGNYSFLETTATTNMPASIEYQTNALTGFTYQNLGIGSVTTTNIATRFSNDSTAPLASLTSIHPRIAIIDGGVNDIAGAGSESTYVSNMRNIFDHAQADPSISTVIAFKILPWTNGTNVQMQTRDTWNSDLETLADNYSKVFVVDTSSYIGQNRSGGDAGNMWDIIPAYNADGVHFNQDGYTRVAESIFDALSTTTSITSIGATVSDSGATISWHTDQNSSSKVDFGLDSNYGSTTATLDNASSTMSHSVGLTGLTPCTNIHYRVRSINAVTNETVGDDHVFSTSGCTGDSTILASTTVNIAVSEGGTASLGNIALTVPSGYSSATSSAIFALSTLDYTPFSEVAGHPTGKASVGTSVYNIKSFSDSTTTISSFDVPLSISMSYSAGDANGFDETSLMIYRYDSGSWYALDSCTVDTSVKTVECQTNNFSDFEIFGVRASLASVVAPTNNASGSTISGTSVLGNPYFKFLFKTPSNKTNQLVFERDLKVGMTGDDIKILQQFLNANGYVLASAGAGSPGSETRYFGAKTRNALMKFQGKYASDILAPLKLKNPTGYFGQSTRNFMYRILGIRRSSVSD